MEWKGSKSELTKCHIATNAELTLKGRLQCRNSLASVTEFSLKCAWIPSEFFAGDRKW